MIKLLCALVASQVHRHRCQRRRKQETVADEAGQVTIARKVPLEKETDGKAKNWRQAIDEKTPAGFIDR
jgi:hypothetical protein